ncbi:MAG: transposase [Dehalococcoidia bacterium]|nr:transposase [Dehalococcoidia bacterium]
MPDDIPFHRATRLPSGAYSNPANTFHLTLRASPKTRPFRGAVGQAVWDAVGNEQDRGAIFLVAACLMPDHLHVVLRPSRLSVPRWAQSFKPYTTRLARELGNGPFLWQPRYHDRLLREGEVAHAVAYVVRNPIAAGLATEDGEWPWVVAVEMD